MGGGSPDGHAPAAACVGGGAFGDARPDALVTFYGAAGDIVGTAHLKTGHVVTQGGSEYCVMPFVATLDKKSDAYQAEFGSYGKVTVDPAGLGDVSLSIG